MYQIIPEQLERHALGGAEDPSPTILWIRRSTAEQVHLSEANQERIRRAAARMNRDPEDVNTSRSVADVELLFLASHIEKVEGAFEEGDSIEGLEAVTSWLRRVDDWVFKLIRVTIRGSGMLTQIEAER